jgi:hypothetical protein
VFRAALWALPVGWETVPGWSSDARLGPLTVLVGIADAYPSLTVRVCRTRVVRGPSFQRFLLAWRGTMKAQYAIEQGPLDTVAER